MQLGELAIKNWKNLLIKIITTLIIIIELMIIDINPSLSSISFRSLNVSLTSFVGDFDDYNLKKNEYNKLLFSIHTF